MVIKELTEIPIDGDVVLLDLDDTLYDYHHCHEIASEAMLKKWMEKTGGDAQKFQDDYKHSRIAVKQRHPGKAISHSRLFYSQNTVESLLKTTDASLILELHGSYWNSFIEAMTLYDDVLPFLSGCKKKRVPVILVTDMTAQVQFRKVVHLDINQYLDFIVTSEEAGTEKPDSAIYLLAIEKARKIKSVIKSIIVVGDDVERDTFISEEYEVLNYHVKRT